MRSVLKIIFFVAVVAYGVESQHVCLIGSHLIPEKSAYKVYLTSHDLTKDSIVNVTMKSDSGYETHKIFENFEGDLHQEVTFELPKDPESTYRLNIVHKSKSSNSCKKQTVKIRSNRNVNMIFTQLDKPYYKNDDDIHFRIFVMNRLLVPFTDYKNMDVKILDGKSNPVRHFKDVRTSEFGVFENSLKIGHRPFFGMWKIQTTVDGRINTKDFLVQDWNENEFEVLIDAPKEVAAASRKVYLDIKVKHPVDKFFTGIVKISAFAKFSDSEITLIKRDAKTAIIEMGNLKVVLDIEEDLGIIQLEKDMDVTLDVNIIEDRTRHSQKHVIKFLLRTKGRSHLKIDRDPYFKPGFLFPFTIRANSYETGEPDESFNSVKLTVDYGTFGGSKRYVRNLNKGKIRMALEPPIDAKTIKLQVELSGSVIEDEIEAYPVKGNSEYMQATKKLTNDAIYVTAKTSGNFETLHAVVIGPFGVVYTNSFPSASGKDNFEFTIAFNKDMQPEAHVIVFYIRSTDGEIIRDDFQVKTGFDIDNSLNITILGEVKYNDIVSMNIGTQKGSKVFLSAIDNQKPYIISRNNEVSRSDVYNEMSGYLNQNYNSVFSTSFVVQPLVFGGSCDEESDEDEDNHRHGNLKWLNQEEMIRRTYFLDTWIREDLQVTTDQGLLIQRQLPDSFETWRIQGISAHPTMGFAVLKDEPIVDPTPEFLLKVHVLSKIRLGEVFRIDISAYNFLPKSHRAQVYVNIDNANFMERKVDKYMGRVCRTYSNKTEVSKSLTLELPGESTSNPEYFDVQPKEEGKLTIKVTATTDKSHDEVIKVVEVRKREEPKTAVHDTILFSSKTEEQVEKFVIFNEPRDVEVKNVYMTVSDNLLGPVLDDANKISILPRDYMEQRIDEFQAALIRAEYFESRNIKLTQDHIDDIHKGYQHAIRIIDNPNELPAPLWLQSQRASAMISARKYTKLDITAVEKVLDRIVARHNGNGSFYEEPLYDTRREIGTEKFQQHILTAKIVTTLLEYRKFSAKYDRVIEKSVYFLNSTRRLLKGDYEKIIVANALRHAGDHASAYDLICNLKKEYLQTEIAEEDMSMYVEFAAYSILTKLHLKKDPKVEVEWLLNHRNAEGSYYSSYDTTLAIKAINAYVRMKNYVQTSLKFSVDEEKVSLVDGKLSQIVDVRKKEQYKILTTGNGFGYAQVFYEYVEKKTTNVTFVQEKYFSIDLKTKFLPNDIVELDVTVKLKPGGIVRTNVALVEIELPSGYQYYDGDDNKDIEMTQLKEDKQHVVYYIEIFNKKTVLRQKLQAIKVFLVENYAESTIRVYDYYRSNLSDELKYDLDKNSQQCAKIQQLKDESESRKGIGSLIGQLKQDG